MSHFYERLNVLVMPTDACNMNCLYCFHRSFRDNEAVMSLEMVERLLAITTPFFKKVYFLWHGGEPLLMGLDFYNKVLELQKRTACRIKNSIQSNLTLMTPEFAVFLRENNFGISGSYDGVCNMRLRGNDETILQGRQMVIKQGGNCGLIMVASRQNIHSLIDSYIFFRDNCINYSLNLYHELKGCEIPDLHLDEKETVERLNELFTYWVHDSKGCIDISYFKHILEFIFGQKKSVCTYSSCLGRWIGVRSNGEIVPCNRYFPEKYSFGNIIDYSDIGEAFDSEGFANILSEAITRREKCKPCEIYDFCNGGCNNVAFNENGIENNNGLSCKILKGVYSHINNFVERITSSRMKVGEYNPRFEEMMRKRLLKASQ